MPLATVPPAFTDHMAMSEVMANKAHTMWTREAACARTYTRTHQFRSALFPLQSRLNLALFARCCALCTLSVVLLDRAVVAVSDLAEVPSRSPSSTCVGLWWPKAAVVGVVFRSCNCGRRVDVWTRTCTHTLHPHAQLTTPT
jgi:hypothetical protein